MSETELKDIEAWLLPTIAERGELSAEQLIELAGNRFSPSSLTWAIWYLKSAGQLRVTRNDLVASA